MIFKYCTTCHGIDDYAYNALDRAGWDAHLTAKHRGLDVPLPAGVARGAARLAGDAVRPGHEAVSAHLRGAGGDDVLHRRRGGGAAQARLHVVPRHRAGERRALQPPTAGAWSPWTCASAAPSSKTRSSSGWWSGSGASRGRTTVIGNREGSRLRASGFSTGLARSRRSPSRCSPRARRQPRTRRSRCARRSCPRRRAAR